MLINILYGLPTMAVCLLLESLLLLIALRYYVRREAMVKTAAFWSTLLVVNGVMLMLVIGNIAQIGIWALLLQMLGEFADFNTAFYHSAMNFATLGYGDIVMSNQYKLLGPLEAINGVLMIGVSTAVLMAVFQDAMKKTIQARLGKEGTWNVPRKD
ncbi:ion channel [Planctomycetota bacterium]